MRLKAFIFIAGLFFIQFVASCCEDTKFMDFEEMEIFSEKDTIDNGELLILELRPTDATYFASDFDQFSFSNMHALSCSYAWGGMKFPITKVEITSDTDFDDNHLRGTLLNDLFSTKSTLEEDILENFTVDRFPSSKLLLEVVPSLSKKHIFTIELTKSNDEKITAISDEIIWN